MSQVTAALDYLKQGLSLAKSPGLRPYVIIPMVFNVLVFGGLYYFFGQWIGGWVAGLAAGWEFGGAWSFLNPAVDFLVGAAVVLVWIVLLGLFASVFTLGVQLIAAPFMGFLA
ncbi:MAG TPA: sulfate transporter CysZ, partial [Alcanivorax sp.]|nr:sulfate transporter CysZ [Alcanivorax sp.]